MGPVIAVPDDVAGRLKEETDLVEVDEVLPDIVETLDVQLGDEPGDILLLTETPAEGFGRLIDLIADSEYAKSGSRSFALTVSDQQGNPHAFAATEVSEETIRNHLALAYFGEPGNRRPLLRP